MRRTAAGGLPADARHRDLTCAGRRARAPGRPRHRVGERGQPGLRLAGGEAHGPRPRTATPPSPGCRRALRALELDGLETNRELLGAVLDDGVFRAGEADVHYLDGRPDLRDAVLPDEARRRHAAAAACCLAARAGGRQPRPGARRRLAQRRPGPARRPVHRRRGDARGACVRARSGRRGPGRRRMVRGRHGRRATADWST